MNDRHDELPATEARAEELFQSLFRAAAPARQPIIIPGATSGPAPLSAAQRQMWLLHQLAPDSPAYNTYRAFLLAGRLDLNFFKAAIDEIVNRHAALRTTFAVSEGQPVQTGHARGAFDFSFIDLTSRPPGTPAGDIEAALQALLVAEAQKTFDLARGPCLRITLCRLAEEQHGFLLVMPHIVCDGWSIAVFLNELAAGYEALAAGRPPVLPELVIQYPDFARWQQAQRPDDPAADPHLSYWREQLAGAVAGVPLPADRPRPPVRSFKGASQPFVLAEETVRGLRRLGGQAGATLYMVLLAAFKALLFRYSGRTDIVVGSPIANRDQPEIRNLIGCFVNTLALRSDLAGEPTFRGLLARVRRTALDAYAHRQTVFQQLLEMVQPDRGPGGLPFFNTVFVMQNTPAPVREFGGLQLQALPLDNRTAKYDLSLVMEEGRQTVVGRLEYSTDLFSVATGQRLARHFQTLLAGIVADPDRPVSALPLLTREEEQQILLDWNDTARQYPGDSRVHRLFEAQARAAPAALAVIFEQEHLTYRQLNCRANQLANYLRARGVGPDTPVALCVEPSLAMVTAILGILKAGGAYVPFDPAQPAERLAFMLDDCRVPLLLTEERLLDRFAGLLAEVVCLDRDWPAIAGESSENPNHEVGPENLVYVIYTSGSTGRPKGCLNTHGALANLILWTRETFPLTATDRVLQRTPFTFDPAAWELFWPLTAGATLVVAKPGGHREPRYLIDLIAARQITAVQFVPAMLTVFLEEEGVGRCRSLKWVFCGGEVLSAALQQRFYAAPLSAALINLYGPTEAAVDVAYWTCRRQSRYDFVPIGRPVANTRLYVLDPGLQPVPVGVAGELHIGGVQVARGYLNRPELTAAKFIADPFSGTAGARLYKTGDLARYHAGGVIEYLGRLDRQVKIRGFRIEPGEIEQTLARHPLVRDGAVIAGEEAGGDGRRLLAYVATGPAAPPSIRELRAFLRARLPDYMVPADFIILDKLPLTASGKIDRRALPPPLARPAARDDFAAARPTELEEWLCALWQDLLAVDQVDVHDDFFELGGHSLLAMQLVARVRHDLAVELAIRDVFDVPTVAGLAKIIKKT